MLATNKDLKRLGGEIRRRRIALRLSQDALAKRAGFSNKQLNHVEYGVHWPSIEAYISLCRVLGIGPIPMVD